jgi:metal-responsive CopG/Arc/MetJ family transcriptional regulator
MKQPTLHISFDAEDLDLFNKINEISSAKRINKSGLVRDLIRQSLTNYGKSNENQSKTPVSIY